MISVRWHNWNGAGLEHCVCRYDNDGLSLEGVVAGTRHGLYGAHYLVRTDRLFRTREVTVNYVGGARMHVEADGEGNWTNRHDHQPIAALEGCIDVDIGVTPATNALPIKRLQLRKDESQDILAAYVPLPDQIEGDFLPRPAPQRYTCLVPAQTYRYEGLFRGFTAVLEIDQDGLVIDYPDTFRRVPLSA
ncbi:putative glycolipid-binding domain-containing protein [Yoonia sp. GPGPB17]|uniref:putative glycolipid-binding domain-containing protein n=1 Tax=Yoonia sp. GPGPB17 TaxID=3026147 RepID=UPI0030BEC18B